MIPLDRQVKCAGRELGLRRAVYPKFIASKRMTEAQAADEIEAMEAIYETLKRLAAQESAAETLKNSYDTPRRGDYPS